MPWPLNSPFPARLEGDARVVQLTNQEPRNALLLHKLYNGACDQAGRFVVAEELLRLSTKMVTGPALVPAVKRLAGIDLVWLYPDGDRLIAQLADYDSDLTARQREKRAPSKLPPPPKLPPEGAPVGQSWGTQVPPAGASRRPRKGQSATTQQGTQVPPQGAAGGVTEGHSEGISHSPAFLPPPSSPPTPPSLTTPNQPPPRDPEGGAGARPTPAGGTAAPLVVPEQARPAAPSSRPELALVPEPPWPTPTPAPTTWPPGTDEAGAKWWARLQQERPHGCGYTLTDVVRLAAENPDVFADAVDEHTRGVKGWKRTDPFAWLRRQCGFVREDRADRATRGRARADRGDQLPAVRQPREPFVGWNWRWDQVAADTPGLDAAWPSALDLPPDQHEALAWCTHTPDGPVHPPRRLADVPGAVDAYRAAHAPPKPAEAVA